MKQWLMACLFLTALVVSGCSPNPTEPEPDPTATPIPPRATATATPISGGGLPTPTPAPTPGVSPSPTPAPTPGGTAYTVRYEVISDNANVGSFTYLDNYASYNVTLAPGTWTETVTMNAGFKTSIILAYGSTTPPFSVTANIYVNGEVKATETRSGSIPGNFTLEYWLP